MDDEQREDLLDHMNLDALTLVTITDRERLLEELAAIRRKGYSESEGERVSGGAAISAPIFAPDGSILAAVSVLGPDSRLNRERRRELTQPLVAAAQAVSDHVASNDDRGAEQRDA